MIKEIKDMEIPLLMSFLKNDVARNYFILLGLYSKKTIFDKIYGDFNGKDLGAVLFKRKSGTLQFYTGGDFNINGFTKIIKGLDYKGLIGARSYCDDFFDRGLFSTKKEGAYISKLDGNSQIQAVDENKLHKLQVEDLDDVLEIYKDVFVGFSPKEIMEEKLRTNRGRGICYKEDGRILSLAQTEFETEDSSLIVGVATHNSHRNKGLATLCMLNLIYQLRRENKDIFLQYDNLEAGRIYERLGFKTIDQVIHYIK